MTATQETNRATPLPYQEITVHTNTLDILANAKWEQKKYNLGDYFIVDVDAHHVETDSWNEILDYLTDPVLKDMAVEMQKGWPVTVAALHNQVPGLYLQDVSGRIPHQASLSEETPEDDIAHRDVTLVQRAIEAMGIDMQVVFPQPMLEMGLHPHPRIATELMNAYNRWFTEQILPRDKRIISMIGLPFHDPQASVETIRRYADLPQVVGFLITSQRHVSVHRNEYMKIYAELEERGMAVGFHAGPTWGDSMTTTMNRFLSVHAMSFVTCNMTHMTNWVINGIPERFPNLKTIWIESGLAWLPFMMQRLDHEFVMRQSDAPLLKKLPSDYMRDMYFTSQPMEITDLGLLESTLVAMDAENTLMWSSDWPHWDFDLPGRIFKLPGISEQGRRNILGETARKVFNL